MYALSAKKTHALSGGREDRQQDTIRPPPFGNASAPWPVVSAFYDYWSTFASYKDFAWADEYHLGQVRGLHCTALHAMNP